MKIKNLKIYFSLFIVAILVLSFSKTELKTEKSYISIEELFLKKAINVTVTGLGGHQEECIEFEIENKTDSTVYLEIEPGRRLVSADSTLQDIFIVKQQLLALLSKEKIKVKGYGFCCESSSGSPYTNAIFSVGYMAPPDWIKLAKVINDNNFPVDAVQHAIWVLSNNHDISSVNAEDMFSIKELRETLSEILNIEIPWFSMSYAKDTTQLFSDRPEMLYGEFSYYIKNNGIVTINIRNSSGVVVKTLLKEAPHDAGNYKYYLNLSVINLPKGEYEIYVFEDYGKLNMKKKFVL